MLSYSLALSQKGFHLGFLVIISLIEGFYKGMDKVRSTDTDLSDQSLTSINEGDDDLLGAATKDPDKSISWTRAIIDRRLRRITPAIQTAPSRLHQAMSHTLLMPGKRYRPLLTVLVSQAYGVDNASVYDVACTAELVHVASLILDDLPCMDDAELRRNAPCTHTHFDESTAILAATALLNLAYGIIAEAKDLTAEQRIELCRLLSFHVGSNGLIAGQMMDLMNTESTASIKTVETLNRLKTGALLSYSVEAACVVASVPPEEHTHLAAFANEVGLAYQLMDDVMDQHSTQEEAQKDRGQDAGKSTILNIRGLPYVRKKVGAHIDAAKDSLKKAGLGTDMRLALLLDRQFAVSQEMQI